MDTKQKRIRVLMFPWLAHSHISSFLELAKKLMNHNLYVYFCSTATNLDSIKPKISPHHSLSIQFIELKLPLLPELPSYYHTTKGLPTHLLNALFKAVEMSGDGFATILKTHNPDLLIYDLHQPWAPTLASSLNIPAILFYTASAAGPFFAFHAWKKLKGEEFPSPEFYINDCFMPTKSSRNEFGRTPPDSSNTEKTFQAFRHSLDIILVKSFSELEGKYMDYLSILLNKKVVPTGPLVRDAIEEHHENEKEILEWLTKKRKASTVLVSFGSEYYLSNKEREAIAEGLELSEVNFIWVLRFPVGDKDKPKLEEALPEGYLERIGERGLMVEGWAPQAKILQHSSIGGFVSHCGWSSVMESLKFGVPIIAMPMLMHIDQPLNARLVQDVGVGVEVKRGKDGSLEREEIVKVIKQVVGEKDGENIRNKAREMSNHIKIKRDEEVDEVVQEINKILHKGGLKIHDKKVNV
ncbi:hypothetical protein ES319_D01G143400v1 [Gossypium barbadense]|uniref:Glycosyltransferase N-terminal domain-containing protein n=1 Tax=Gossypium barbadense TaxID=3634 RepID=A0A5J5SNU0_GOSBA|nr:hypothetical protein ES319_D01G143400v1 [Gossypium barbadense]